MRPGTVPPPRKMCAEKARMTLFSASLVVLGSCLLAAPALAEDVNAEGDAETDEEVEIPVLEVTREGLHESAYWLVTNVDSWFGERPFEEHGRVSGTLRTRALYREDDGLDTDFRYRLQVHMPNVSEWGYLFIGRDNERELIRDEDEAFRREQSLLPESRDEDQTFFVGIGRLLRENLDVRLGVRGGYKLYAQARYRKTWWVTDDSNIDYRQTLFIAVADGLGTTTGLNYALALGPDTAFRWRNSATIGTETDGVEWSTSLGLYRTFGRDHELSFELLGKGDTDGAVLVKEYGLRAIYSRPLYRDWIIGELIGGYFWPRGEEDPERYETAAAGLGVEFRF
ncbi:MAG: hypothetical protein EA347_03500 [Thioalkalivibrio sp.]|nr:MAG: hypothetical protein EA347_03500 [Thioalkalivibrio sp.]